MIGYLEGTQVAALADSVVVLTEGGVGYQVYLPIPLLARTGGEPGRARYYISTVVRDNEISLFGFEKLQGKTLFELLLKVSGIGPRVALALLSAFSPDDLVTAVARDDVALLASVPGIGKKTATRLCLDLQDRLAKWDGIVPEQAAPNRELQSALTNLGFPEKEVFTAIRRISPDGLPFSDQLKQALALLARR